MNKKSILSIAILSSFASSAFALDSSRFSGEIIFATGYMSTNSNLSTESDALLKDRTKKAHTMMTLWRYR